jgi:hypothetical protein
MKWGFALSCLALLAVPNLAEATPTTIDFTALKNSQGIGGDTLQGSFTFDLSQAANVQQNPTNNSATYSLTAFGAAAFQFTTGSITEQGGGPLTVFIQAGNGPTDDQDLTITGFVPSPLTHPQILLDLSEFGSPHDLTGTGAPTFLSRQDWSDASVVVYSLTDPQELIGQYLIQTVSVVDEPGSLPVLAMGLIALVGCSRLRRKVGAETGGMTIARVC